MASDWYSIQNIATLDTPALAVYPERVSENIRVAKQFVSSVNMLRPHMKTTKSGEIARMLMDHDINKFKCATIAEAEMLAEAGAPDVLLAYQPVGPKADRLVALVKKFPATSFACLLDAETPARALAAVFEAAGEKMRVYIDLNVGMNRTGIAVPEAGFLAETIRTLRPLVLDGLHVYDGHLRDADLSVRTRRCNEAFEPVAQLRAVIEQQAGHTITVIAGGTPTFPIHARRHDVECSPGTFIYWDQGYASILQEQPFLFAALVVTRVVSKPGANTLCLDLGHKSIASENALTNRATFLHAPGLKPLGHSEEHMVVEVSDGSRYAVGDVLYGVPYHVCPTVALYDRAAVVEGGHVRTYWNNLARNRVLTV